MHPNFYVIAGVLKNDLVETERHLDMMYVGRLENPRVNNATIKKYEQRAHLKDALRDGMDLESYLTAMGATNMKVDAKTKLRFRQDRGITHRRRTLDAVLDNVVSTFRINKLSLVQEYFNKVLFFYIVSFQLLSMFQSSKLGSQML